MLVQKQFQDIFTFTRASGGGRINASGQFEWVAANQPRFDYDLSAAILNLITGSDSTSSATFFNPGVGAFTDNGLVAVSTPYGATQARKITVTTTARVRWGDTVSGLPGTTYTGAVWVATADGQTRAAELYTNLGGTNQAITITPTFQFFAQPGSNNSVNAHRFADLNKLPPGEYYIGRIGMFIGSYTAAQIAAAGGIPQTATTPAYGNVQPKGLLIEEQKTNLLDRGNAVGQAGGTVPVGWGLDQWFGGVNPSFSTNKTNSFGRSASVWSVVGTTSQMNRLLVSPNTAFPGSSVTPGNSYSFGIDMACSAGYGGGITFSFIWYNSSNTILSVSDVATSGIGQSASRLTGTAVAPANAAALRIRIDFTSMPAIGTNVNFTYEIGAAQIEVGNPSSYIPTSGSQATRAADLLSINTLSPWFGSDGTLYAEFVRGGTSSKSVVSIDSSDTSKTIGIWLDGTNVNGEATGYSILNQPIPAGVAKTSFAWSSAGTALSVNGAPPSKSSSSSIPAPLAKLNVGKNRWSDSLLNGHIRKIRYFPKRLTDAQLQALTA